MKNILAIFFLVASFFSAIAQDSEKIENLIQEGIALHDKGYYSEAIKKYNAVLGLDKNNFDANYEKSYSLYVMGKLKEAASISKDLLKKFSDHPGTKALYIQYGSILDDLGKGKEAIEIYEEGILKFPAEYLLYFNKGLTQQKMGENTEALLSYENSLKLKPLHATSNYNTGFLIQKQNRIPAFLAYATFLAIEPNTKRSKDGFDKINQIMGLNIKKEGNSTALLLDPSALGDKKNKTENDFSSVEMLFSLLSISDNSKEIDSIASTSADKLSLKIQMLINSLSNNKKDGIGFYWEHYVPFFEAMKENKMVATLAHLIYKPAMEAESDRWLEKNDKAIEEFNDWLKAYKWGK